VTAFRLWLITCFTLLAVLIPGIAIRSVPKDRAQRRRIYCLLGLLWSLLVAGVYAVLRDWRHGSEFAVQDALRTLAVIFGSLYIFLGFKGRAAVRPRAERVERRPVGR
jgi:heme A synthase